MGRARYAADNHPPRMLHAVMAVSSIARGRETGRPWHEIVNEHFTSFQRSMRRLDIAIEGVPVDPSFVPEACTAPVVNVSAATGNQAETFVVVNPTNTNNIVAFSNSSSSSIYRAYSTNGGSTWTRGTVAAGAACCDGQAVWDSFGNLFLVYLNASASQANLIVSTNGGATFGAPVTVGTGCTAMEIVGEYGPEVPLQLIARTR